MDRTVDFATDHPNQIDRLGPDGTGRRRFVRAGWLKFEKEVILVYFLTNQQVKRQPNHMLGLLEWGSTRMVALSGQPEHRSIRPVV